MRQKFVHFRVFHVEFCSKIFSCVKIFIVITINPYINLLKSLLGKPKKLFLLPKKKNKTKKNFFSLHDYIIIRQSKGHSRIFIVFMKRITTDVRQLNVRNENFAFKANNIRYQNDEKDGCF
jgi:hypothetical protein